jgi:hypothetical protein
VTSATSAPSLAQLSLLEEADGWRYQAFDSSSSASAGVFHPSVLRGLPLSVTATALEVPGAPAG